MKRRDFLKTGFYGSALMGSAVNLLLPSKSVAAHANVVPKTLVNVLLQGGADMRFVLAPRPDHDATYIAQYWAARKALYSSNYASYAEMYAAEYVNISPATGSNVTVSTPFGVHKSCGWLLEKFNAGNVAIVANVFGSENRRHDHALLIINSGDSTIGNLDFHREGWGGRLVESISQTSNVVSVSEHVPMFVKGRTPGNPLAQVIHSRDMRNMALPSVDYNLSGAHSRNIARRALKAYYDARSDEIDVEKAATWPYRRFFKHYDSINYFGRQINDRLVGNDPLNPIHPLPLPLHNLDLNDDSFAQQCRNVYDICLTADLLQSRVLSMIRTGWDTHKNQESSINNNLQDVFGATGGLATLSSTLNVDIPGANDNLLYYFSSDFGRQLAANGDSGTDHGIGSYSIIIGSDVNGGVYGDMFPQYEAEPDPEDGTLTPFEIPGTDVKGETSFEYVCREICDWVQPGTGSLVFQNPPEDRIEPGVVLSSLFRST